jgi:hypothetical protein
VASILDALHAIPESNAVSHIFLNFIIISDHPFDHVLSRGWRRLAREISRISSVRALGVEIYVCIAEVYCQETKGRRELYGTTKAQMDEVWGNEPHVNA